MKKIISVLSIALFPAVAFAQTATWFTTLLATFQGILKSLFPILTAVAVLFFFWELIKYIRATAEEKSKARSGLLYSILALFILLTFFGIIQMLAGALGITAGGSIDSNFIPSVDL